MSVQFSYVTLYVPTQTSVFIMRSCFVLIAVGVASVSASSSSSLSSLDSTVFLSLNSTMPRRLALTTTIRRSELDDRNWHPVWKKILLWQSHLPMGLNYYPGPFTFRLTPSKPFNKPNSLISPLDLACYQMDFNHIQIVQHEDFQTWPLDYKRVKTSLFKPKSTYW